jgi:hypothetical protein
MLHWTIPFVLCHHAFHSSTFPGVMAASGDIYTQFQSDAYDGNVTAVAAHWVILDRCG